VGIIIACLPSSRLLVLRYLPSKLKERRNRSTRATCSSHTKSSHTTRSSKFGSTATWVSGLSGISGKRDSGVQQSSAVPLSHSHVPHVLASSPGAGPDAVVSHPRESASVASGLGRRESELPLVPGFESSRPAPVAGQNSHSGLDECPVATPVPKDRRIWVEQHIYVSNDPVTQFSTDISHGDNRDTSSRDDEDSLPPWVPRPRGT
jgi:hypothetical protein